jgi:hypothetical protein
MKKAFKPCITGITTMMMTMTMTMTMMTTTTISCSDREQPAGVGELLVIITGRCTATVKLYDYSATKQLDRQDFDCEHAAHIQFKPPQTGLYIIIATSGDREEKTVCSFVQGYSKEITIDL